MPSARGRAGTGVPSRRGNAVAVSLEKADAPVKRRGSVTTRAAMLGLVISALALLIAVPLRTYLTQRSAITATEQAQAAQRHRIALLQQQNAHNQDPAVIEQQARTRLQLVEPGETDYVVITPPKAVPKPAKVGRSTALVPASVGDQTWYGALWGSVTVAGNAPTSSAPTSSAPAGSAPTGSAPTGHR